MTIRKISAPSANRIQLITAICCALGPCGSRTDWIPSHAGSSRRASSATDRALGCLLQGIKIGRDIMGITLLHIQIGHRRRWIYPLRLLEPADHVLGGIGQHAGDILASADSSERWTYMHIRTDYPRNSVACGAGILLDRESPAPGITAHRSLCFFSIPFDCLPHWLTR